MSRSRGASRLTTRSPIDISPADTASSPASIRSAVVFPEPDGPTSTMNSPSAISSDSERTAATAPKRLETSANVTRAISGSSRAYPPEGPLALDRPGQHPADEVALQEHVEHDDRQRHDHRPRGEQREVRRVAAREERQPERRGAQRLLRDHHEREQELVPRPHEDEHGHGQHG